MIITAVSSRDAIEARRWLEENGYSYKYSLYWSEEWRRDESVVFLHKGYSENDTMNHEWRAYTL